MENKNYGVIRTTEEVIPITEISRIEFKDKRFVTIAETEKDTYAIMIENLKSSGRCVEQHLHLTKESMIAVMAAIIMHLEVKGVNVEELIYQCDSSEDRFNFESTIINNEEE